jgi:hypothetical protein
MRTRVKEIRRPGQNQRKFIDLGYDRRGRPRQTRSRPQAALCRQKRVARPAELVEKGFTVEVLQRRFGMTVRHGLSSHARCSSFVLF